LFTKAFQKKLVEWLKGHRTGNAAVRDLVELTGSVCLATWFDDRYPEYPTFTAKLSASNLKQPTEDVLRWLAGGVRNNFATAVLDGLDLLDGDKLRPPQSRYAKVVLEKLATKPPGQVVNRKELITVKNDVERECRYQLEPEFLLIVLASLVQKEATLGASGQAVLTQLDDQLDTMLENWRKTLLDNLADPTVKKSISLLPDDQQSAVEGFLKSKKLPDKIDTDLVQGVQAALSGLTAINVIPADLLDSLSAGGTPSTVDQLRTRFEDFLQRMTRGKEAAKVRLIIVRGEKNEGPN
jgi:Family of unknown function (DUF6079)